MIGRLALDEQLVALKSTLSRNSILLEVLNRAADLKLPDWYVTGGCLFQTVWNVVTNRPATSGIKDYDVFYFDRSDLSWTAEDREIEAARDAFADLPAEVEVRNEARVHLWYRVPAVRLHGGGDQFVRGHDLLPRSALGSRRAVAHLRAARACRRVQPGRTTESRSRPESRLRDQNRPLAPAMARAHGDEMARMTIRGTSPSGYSVTTIA
jgi:hypothetical protein